MADKTLIYAGAISFSKGTGGLWRKEAADDQWQELEGNGLPHRPEVFNVSFHPNNPSQMYLGTDTGLYLSRDSGDHWGKLALKEGEIPFAIAFHPKDPRIMYVGTQGNRVHRTDDGGGTWRYMSTIEDPDVVPLPEEVVSEGVRILWITMEPNNPDMMYAAIETGGSARSYDAGKTWEVINSAFKGDVDNLDHHTVALGSPDRDVLFIANRTGVWRTRDKGDTWENTHVDKFSPTFYSHGAMVAPDDPNTVYACIGQAAISTGGGLMRSTDLGETWGRFDHDVEPRSTTFAVSVNPYHPEQVYFIAQGAGYGDDVEGPGQVFGTHDRGATWKEHSLPEDAKEMYFVACTSA